MLDKIKPHLIEIFASMFLVLFIDWSVGYYANAIFDTKFDLNSCWGGVAALSGAGMLSAVKYIYDSIYNTKMEEKP